MGVCDLVGVLILLSTLAGGHPSSPRRCRRSPDEAVKAPGIVHDSDTALRQVHGVTVRCFSDWLEVVVKADIFGLGVHLDGESLRLGADQSKGGHASCGAVASGRQEFTIAARLADCGTELSFTDDSVVYSNVVTHSPVLSPDGLLRSERFRVPVECHFRSAALVPAWVPFSSALSAEDSLQFKLRLMTNDWQFERSSNVYFLGDSIYMKASVSLSNHKPLRVFVDQCLAAQSPYSPYSEPRYTFIDSGCLSDSRFPGARSQFLSRHKDDELRFMLDAFKFYQQAGNLIYITCLLKAVPIIEAIESNNRACFVSSNSWRSVDGNDQVCQSCEVPQQTEEAAPEHAGFVPFSPPKSPVQHPQLSLSNAADYFNSLPVQGNKFHGVPLSQWAADKDIAKRGAASKEGKCLCYIECVCVCVYNNVTMFFFFFFLFIYFLEWFKTTTIGPVLLVPKESITTPGLTRSKMVSVNMQPDSFHVLADETRVGANIKVLPNNL
uniref:Zona pellucida sperm-binding protein 3 n=1 Tax=Denticeps clupeoides TaxID=299321 RepID=A0AAY4AAM7_9TELE